MTINAPRLPALTLALLLVGGCATTQIASTPDPAISAAILQLDGGQPREAAIALETLASSLRGAARTNALVDAAWGWQLAGDSERSRSLLNALNTRHIAGISAQRHQLLNAQFALADQQPNQALQWLGTPAASIQIALRPYWLLTRSQAQEATGELLGAAASRIGLLENGSTEDRIEQQRTISRLLAGVNDQDLRRGAASLSAGDPLYNHVGRALLARGLPLPRPLDIDPLVMPGLSKRPIADVDGYRPPSKIAILLPLSGQLATAASPVRDGLLAGYYGESRRRPTLDFIDTHGTAAGALAAYDRAVASGADYVIGPLGRDEVDALFDRNSLPVPVQALNHGKDLPPPGHLGFSLAPEDDGAMAADYLLGRERRNAVIVHSNDDTGRRAAAAFKRHFNERGGQIAATVTVNDNPADVSNQLRVTADGVFLAVRGTQARVLVPQLTLAGLGGASKVGSSQLVSGTGKPGEDSVLDGIVYPTERWQSQGVSGLPAANDLAQRLPTARGAAARLLAFGFDAWQISAYPERLAATKGSPLTGATGTLYLDSAGKVIRRPGWATFTGGHTQALRDGY